ncbi:MAG: 2-oxo acid dehydrogenase subunit E2 [Clostridia bacterium]|nr:2-oxo acid dehydrogenase subunit E2 [Clostridia bacterium]
MQKYFKKGWGDRSDGWKLRGIDPISMLGPFIMRTRLDSQVMYQFDLPLDNLEEFIRQHKEEIPGLSLMHVIMAAMVRVISQRPYVNRFIVWNKMYARNNISISLAVKREITDKGEETIIKPEFEPTDTLADIVEKVKKEYDASIGEANGVDDAAKILCYIPSFLLRGAVKLLFGLDKLGILPKFLVKVSPWHSSLFITNVGSVGIDSVFHHLYEFGTNSQFIALGQKKRREITDENGQKKTEKYTTLRFNNDERICDGHYYAASMRMFRKLLLNPEQLLEPPKQVIVDDCVGKKRIDIKQ